MQTQWIALVCGITIGWGVGMDCAIAQITPDGTLPTTVMQSGNTVTIDGGSRSGTNLFHSFSQFSIPTGGVARFNNALDVQTILARVTSGAASTIDGLIQANGTANLFLINPAGILFGPNASLAVGGSFVGTTANSIQFADGSEFSAIAPSASPLLTISVPVGLQFGSNPAPITVQDIPQVRSVNELFVPVTITPGPTNLQVRPGKTLALVGGNMNLSGANLNAPQGRIELGSLSAAGFVGMSAIAQGYTFTYAPGQSFGNLQLTQGTTLNVSGVNAGAIHLQGRHIQVDRGSLLLSQNVGPLPGGLIELQASERIDLIGLGVGILSGVQSEALGTGTGSNIRIATPQLTMQTGGRISSRTFGTATSGNLEITANTITLSDYLSASPAGVTNISTTALGSGNAGDIFVTSDHLLLTDGSALSSVTFGRGSSGRVDIHTATATVRGANLIGIYSNIASTTFGLGSAQALNLETGTLHLLDGGVVAATAFFAGQGGDVNIQATEAIAISGRSGTNPSSINSSAFYPPLSLQQSFGLPNRLTADAGNVRITTPTLVLSNGGTVSVINQGAGNAGNLSITANQLKLTGQSSIAASTESGEGGNITLQIRDLVLLRQGSNITATAGGTGNGGNITLNAPIIAGFENSDIVANALRGKGGNIAITTQGIFGLKFRNQLTPDNDITASSQFGVNGTVNISTIAVTPTAGLAELPTNLTDSSRQIATGCAGNQGSSFVITGRGGVPQNPTQQVESDRPWDDLRDLSAYRGTPNSPVSGETPPVPLLLQADTWRRNPDGSIELIASSTPATFPAIATCRNASISAETAP